MNTELLIPLLTVGGTLLLVVTGLLNFSVFVRQLRAAREQLETARRDLASLNEVKAFAELVLNNFASAIIHSAVFPEYPVRGVEETIRFHLRHSPAMRDFLVEGFDRFQLAGLALI